MSLIHLYPTPHLALSAAATPVILPFSTNRDISAHDALVHVALYLRCAYETGLQALEHLHESGRGMYWSNLHAIEMAEGLVEAMLDGIESAPATIRTAG